MILPTLVLAQSLQTDATRMSESEIFDVMGRIPSECSLYSDPRPYCKPGTLGGYEKGKDARAIARIIAEGTRTRIESVEAAVYAAYESANNLDAEGDCGKTPRGTELCKSHGAWQVPIRGLDGDAQLREWRSQRARSLSYCSANPEAERMALLASGSCDRGRRKVRKRYEAIQELASQAGAGELPEERR